MRKNAREMGGIKKVEGNIEVLKRRKLAQILSELKNMAIANVTSAGSRSASAKADAPHALVIGKNLVLR
jgi:hypothetical protein